MHDALELIPDDALPTTVRRLTAHSSVALADLLAHLGEVERRGIHRERACASLYTYCVYELRMSEDAAFRRAKAARIVRRYPEVREAIAKGEIHLTGLHYKVQFTASQKYLDLLEEAIALLGHESPRPALPDVQLRALELLVSKLRKDRRGAREAKRAREGGGHRAGAGVVTAMRRVRRRAGAGVAALAARFQWALHPAERPAHRVESRQTWLPFGSAESATNCTSEWRGIRSCREPEIDVRDGGDRQQQGCRSDALSLRRQHVSFYLRAGKPVNDQPFERWTCRAGAPTTVVFASTSDSTTAFAPTRADSPT